MNHRQIAMEQSLMKTAVDRREAYACTTMQERQDATVRALEAALGMPDRAKAIDDAMVQQWGEFADLLSGMRKTVEEAVSC